jgi:hypothetical protein
VFFFTFLCYLWVFLEIRTGGGGGGCGGAGVYPVFWGLLKNVLDNAVLRLLFFKGRCV